MTRVKRIKVGRRLTLFGIIVCGVLTGQTAISGTAELLLVPTRTEIHSGRHVAFDIYLYNPGPRATKVPSLDFVSTFCDLTSLTGERTSSSGELHGEISTSRPADQILAANRLERRRIQIAISAKPADLVRVWVEIGQERKLRSNTALLFCPAR